jgi:hypothetical protein
MRTNSIDTLRTLNAALGLLACYGLLMYAAEQWLEWLRWCWWLERMV